MVASGRYIRLLRVNWCEVEKVGLDWQVSADRAEKFQQDSTIAAPDAAGMLGMEIDRFQSIRLGEEPRPIPFNPGRVMAPAAMAEPMLPPRAAEHHG